MHQPCMSVHVPLFDTHLVKYTRECVAHIKLVCHKQRIKQSRVSRIEHTLHVFLRRNGVQNAGTSELTAISCIVHTLEALEELDHQTRSTFLSTHASSFCVEQIDACVACIGKKMHVQREQLLAYKHLPALEEQLSLEHESSVCEKYTLKEFIYCVQMVIISMYESPVCAHFSARDLCLAASYLLLRSLRNDKQAEMPVSATAFTGYNKLIQERRAHIMAIIESFVNYEHQCV